MTNNQPQVVVIGGGTGLPVLLRGLKSYPVDITAIVTVADDGGSSGRLRNELDIPAPGDIRNVLAALSDVEPLVEQMFQHRFASTNELSGHSLGNLLLAAMTSITGDFVHAIQEMSKVLNVRGKVLPSANQSVVLHAEMEDGSIVSGESKIPTSEEKIKRVFLTPEKIKPLRETIQAIRQADLIVIGPGSLYTSILPNLLVPGIGEEVCKSKAKKVYICNLMTQAGETLDYTASDHVKAIYNHMDCDAIDSILVNNQDIPIEVQNLYKEESAKPVFFDVDELIDLNLEIVQGEIFNYEESAIRHDTKKVAGLLYGILLQERKRKIKK
ncbi:YvcK family protein [Peribacillus psychrosaccharolyticus]|uniref:Gluconeogenesis factor n=1 Tax=Peribacillus psychrosaccharolyticus TaxID=1407 RepID=A0A974NKF4_PERPY|nr:YvcK family protein [Peribacillus psychrosaccharolyticus]MEC2055543.1 YvcK family protein [Peribacillus psychrosaccharolyticus]MED3743429.1 YvcK family protein [Peribacillus psychrosaccharolyticus]QQS99212.1 YvcK family protein [Peribacillus psychrosaccharolyticus]